MNEYFKEMFLNLKEKYQNPTIEYMRKIDLNIVKSYSNKYQKLLDIGFGDGWHMEQLYKQGYNVQGLEISSVLIENLKSRLRDVKLYHGNIESNNLKIDEKYDLIYSFFCVLNLVSNIKQAFRNINKLLKKDGYFIFSIENKHSIFSINKALKNNPNKIIFYKNRAIKYSIKEKEFKIEMNVYDKKYMKRILKKYGFEVEKIGGIFLIVKPCFSIINNLRVNQELMEIERKYMWDFPFNNFGEIQYFICRKTSNK